MSIFTRRSSQEERFEASLDRQLLSQRCCLVAVRYRSGTRRRHLLPLSTPVRRRPLDAVFPCSQALQPTFPTRPPVRLISRLPTPTHRWILVRVRRRVLLFR